MKEVVLPVGEKENKNEREGAKGQKRTSCCPSARGLKIFACAGDRRRTTAATTLLSRFPVVCFVGAKIGGHWDWRHSCLENERDDEDQTRIGPLHEQVRRRLLVCVFIVDDLRESEHLQWQGTRMTRANLNASSGRNLHRFSKRVPVRVLVVDDPCEPEHLQRQARQPLQLGRDACSMNKYTNVHSSWMIHTNPNTFSGKVRVPAMDDSRKPKHVQWQGTCTGRG